jgi:K+-transporting ATPase A subunit
VQLTDAFAEVDADVGFHLHGMADSFPFWNSPENILLFLGNFHRVFHVEHYADL